VIDVVFEAASHNPIMLTGSPLVIRSTTALSDLAFFIRASAKSVHI
jgi:hypothetical protein